MPKPDHVIEERSQNVYQRIMRLTAQNEPLALQEFINQAKTAGSLDDNLLRLALQNAARKGREASARVLLENGAKTDLTGKKGSPALFWAVSQPQAKGHIQVTRLLLHGSYPGCPVDTEWRDETGSTIFMSAAFRGHIEALDALLEAGANVNARDRQGRNILHLLAADKRMKWNRAIVSLILDKPIDLDVHDGRHRTPLHWAAATGKKELVEQLLERRKYQKPNVNKRTRRGKTALHLACDADSPDPSIVEILLAFGADPAITSDGGFTCLHNSASVQSSVEIVNKLLDHSPNLVNAQTSPGLTALHFAAQAGSLDVVNCLLSRPETKLNPKDAFYSTPLLRAAQLGLLDVVDRLAPFNNTNRLSTYALAACNNFEATIVDFRYGGAHQNIVQKHSVYEVLYGMDEQGDHLITTQVQNIKSKSKPGVRSGARIDSGPRFRWIHLPANNMAWVEALVAKAFIEDGATDVDGFKAVEKSFAQQHRGQKFHSLFMRPLCERSARGTDSGERLPSYDVVESALRASASQAAGHDIASSPERNGRRRMPTLRQRSEIAPLAKRDTFSTVSEQAEGGSDDLKTSNTNSSANPMITRSNIGAESSSPRTPRLTGSSPVRDTTASQEPGVSNSRRGRQRRRRKDAGEPGADAGADADPLAGAVKQLSRVTSTAASDVTTKPLGSRAKLNSAWSAQAGSNVTFFMPYLHFETDESRRKMGNAIKKAEARERGISDQPPTSHDETLICAHLHSTTGLHMRRTLGQFYLHGIDTEERDSNQVVRRYCRNLGTKEKLIMVDQLWLWILGPGLILTSFPQRWQQPKNDPLNVLEGLIEDINSSSSRTQPRVQSVYDLALLITARCSGSFDRHRPGDEEFQSLDIFESAIGEVQTQEMALYKAFYDSSAAVHAWLDIDRTTAQEFTYYGHTHDQYPDAVDDFINIGKETKLLQEIKVIRDELNTMSLVLHQQRSIIPSLGEAERIDLVKSTNHPKAKESKRKVEEQTRTIGVHLEELARMGQLAGSIEESIRDLLDLKQNKSNALEARFARDQATGTVRQGQIIMVFTMVTIIFLPLSFMAAFFAINIKEFPHDQNGHSQLNLSYVIKYTLGIGLGISLLLIAVAFSLNPLRAFGRRATERWALRRARRKSRAPSLPTSYSMAANMINTTPRASQEVRKSFASSRSIELGPLPRANTGFSDASRRLGYAADLERNGIS